MLNICEPIASKQEMYIHGMGPYCESQLIDFGATKNPEAGDIGWVEKRLPIFIF